jgi:diamine N-acetyltransferase
MYDLNPEDNEYWLPRLMIDKKYQRRGYGKAAMLLLLDRFKLDKKHSQVFLSIQPKNAAAETLFEELGFEPDGRELDGEIVYCLEYR